ncbi:MAG: anthranilate synthase component I [bacterium]
MYYLPFREFEELSKKGNVVPVYGRFLADLLTPVSAFLQLQTASKRAFLLESVEGGEKTARFSFLGCQPFLTLQAVETEIKIQQNGRVEMLQGDIYEYLKQLFSKYRAVHPAELPRFIGGAVGYFGYETVKLIENLPGNTVTHSDWPDACFMLFDSVLAFDHLTHQIYIIANVFLEESSDSLQAKYETARAKIAEIQNILVREAVIESPPKSPNSKATSNFTEERFKQAVLKAKKYIEAGDIFQVVLSQKFQKEIHAAPFDIYRALRVINPSPYLYFLQMDDLCIIGSSPELLVRVEAGVIDVRPIAGTRPRGQNEAEEQRLMQDLRHDEKETAEHLMLVDLGRNDVGRVSEYGSVEVNEFMNIEKYSHVMHLVSNVRGKMLAGYSAIDVLRACFPAGTVSGAPKIRAMEIISELEPERRGVYAGALGYLDFSGNLDTCIAIRTIITCHGQAYFQAGAGIVADSAPQKEYRETIHKAAALQAAIDFAERGLE